MTIDAFLSIGIVGVFLPFVIEKIKMWWFNKDGLDHGREIAIGLSILIGMAFWFLQDTNFWKAALGILAASSVVYDYFLKIAK